MAERLTEREQQVLEGLARGLTTGGIGKELWLAQTTIKTHARFLYRKLGARTGPHAVAIGYQTGLLQLPDTA